MPRHDAAEEAPLRTHRGAVTREQIVRAAARIVFSRGVVGTSIEQVLTASNANRSQLHRYFANKEAVIEAVVHFQVNHVLARQQSLLARVDSVGGLREWADAVVPMNRTPGGVGGCPIGALVGQLADQSSAARAKLEDAFRTCESYLAAALRRMQERGELDAAAGLARRTRPRGGSLRRRPTGWECRPMQRPTAAARPSSSPKRAAPSLLLVVSLLVFRLRGRGQSNAGCGHFAALVTSPKGGRRRTRRTALDARLSPVGEWFLTAEPVRHGRRGHAGRSLREGRE